MKRTFLRLVAPVAVATLALTACSGDSGGSGSESTPAEDGGAASGAVITANGSEPQNPLIPTNTNETGGGKIVDLIYSGLVYYDADGKAQLEMAESIETDDNQLYTVKLKEGQKFTDGSAVTAQNFVDAWNQGVKENHLSSYFFEPIKGFPEGEEKVEAMEGLKVVDDTTFTIELNQPESDFELRLGYSAFFPLPEAGIGDPDAVAAFGKNPVGNGPYMLDGDDAWENNVAIRLVPNPDYDGPRKAQNGGIEMKFYAQQDAAYNDLLSGNLDVLDAVPDSAFGTFENELSGRAINQPSAIFQSFTIPDRLEHFSGEEGNLRKQALSMAIDRDAVCETIFQNTRTPAKDFTSPVIAGWDENAEGNDVLKFDADKAKELWAQADAISPWGDSKFELAYNADGGHQAWVDATVNSIKNTLGIDAVGKPYPDFKSLREEVTNREIQTAFRTGWQADYPALSNFLGPLYGTGAGSNDGDYSNPEFDNLLTQAASASSVDEGNELLMQAQAVLFKDLPAIPLWYSNVTGGYAEGVNNVVFGWNSVPIYYQITK
ncbi:MAG: ABC transporter substrate-binding protein [Actinomycetaceae bacterium]|nr:ABC transporter substrate-binding protein [Actinomycetaceae bacterium]